MLHRVAPLFFWILHAGFEFVQIWLLIFANLYINKNLKQIVANCFGAKSALISSGWENDLNYLWFILGEPEKVSLLKVLFIKSSRSPRNESIFA